MFGFEKLEVWQKAIELADLIYDATRSFPDYEKFGLANQMRRAAVSVSSNIAEGSGRNAERDFIRFLQISYGSLMEVVSQLKIAEKRGFIEPQNAQRIYDLCEQTSRMLSGLRSSLERKVQ
jgi:four helix bundle protein